MKIIAPILALALAASLTAMPAKADVAVSPLRHVLDDDTREARFIVSNPTDRILQARVGWIDLTATETGYREASVTERPEVSAAPWLQLSPAQFQLPPGARQEVMVRLKDGASPPKGERRSHLVIETGAPRTLMRKASARGLQVDIRAGVSVPVLLRGTGQAKAKIGETRLLRDSDGLLMLSTHIEPRGEISSFGRLEIAFEPDAAKGKKEILAVRENVAGYLDTAERVYDLPLGFFSLGKGKLSIRYEGTGEFGGKVFDERRFEIDPPKKD